MDTTKIKQLIGTVAPWIAGSFGTPAMGAAASALCQVFGLDAKTASAPQLEAAISAATPDQLLALKQADIAHSEFMAKLGYDKLSMLYADVEGARKRESDLAASGAKDNTPKVLAAISVVSFFAVLALIAFGFQPAEAMRDGFWMLVGALVVTYKDVYGYYFGSSSGSKDKDATIQGLTK